MSKLSLRKIGGESVLSLRDLTALSRSVTYRTVCLRMSKPRTADSKLSGLDKLLSKHVLISGDDKFLPAEIAKTYFSGDAEIIEAINSINNQIKSLDDSSSTRETTNSNISKNLIKLPLAYKTLTRYSNQGSITWKIGGEYAGKHIHSIVFVDGKFVFADAKNNPIGIVSMGSDPHEATVL